MMQFLPVTMKEMQNRGISQPDFVYVCGDAYVDHPSFGMAIITRLLEHYGYSVGIIAQPDWKKKESVCGFDGKSLYRFQKAQKGRLVFSRRENGSSTGPCSNCVWEFNPSDL